MPELPRIVCVSNRLPVSASETAAAVEFFPSSGGLVTAMGPILRRSRSVWVGWPGTLKAEEAQVRNAMAEFSAQSEFELFPVILDQESIAGFYQGFSNQIIWPLFHDLQSRCNFEPAFWSVYLNVQKLFGKEVLKHTGVQDLVWVHDYHLIGLGRELRQSGLKNTLCFFFHTPFPSPDIFRKLPWRADVLESLLFYNSIGFQTQGDLENFIDCVEALTATRCTPRGSLFSARVNGRESMLGTYPISIDFTEIEEIAASAQVESRRDEIRSDMKVEFLIVSIDRLDYTKGIPYRIKAFQRLLQIAPELKKRIGLLQVVVPSRVEVPEYQQLRTEIEQIVSKLNGELGEPGWVPIHHLFRSITREEVVAMYQAADVALVTPLKDGMNLVAKEYCAARTREDGALVLSEFAGAADELKKFCYLVNPYDADGVAVALVQALSASPPEAHDRMVGMREIIRKADVFNWAVGFLNTAGWEWRSGDDAPRPATIWQKLKRMANVFDI